MEDIIQEEQNETSDSIIEEDKNVVENNDKEFPNLDVDEVMDSIKLKDDNEEEIEKVEINNEEEKQNLNVEDNKIKDEVNKESNDLYAEFNSFIEKKTTLVQDLGVKQTVPTGIDVLDAILGGGFAVGAFNIVVGQAGSGKSMLAIQTLGQSQLKYKGKSISAFLDSEEATTTIRLSNLGVRYPKIKPYTDITVEKVFQFLEGLCLFKEQKKMVDVPSVVIWDSIANTLSQKEREADDPNSVIGYKAKLLSLLLPKYITKLGHYNISLIAVQQLRDDVNIGPFSGVKDLRFLSSGKTMGGGNILRYNSFHLAEMKIRGILKSETYGFDGILVGVNMVKNKLFTPNIEVKIIGDFVRGFSNFWTNYEFLKETKRINSAAWCHLINLPNKSFRTKDAHSLYRTDETFKDAFDELTKDAIQRDIKEKYDPEII